jgi:phage terminase large subunit GpA-like protein
MPPSDFAYADPRRLLAEVFEAAFAPPIRLSVADAALQIPRWLTNEGGGYTGRWRHDLAPYLVAPMECLNGTEFLTVAVVGPGQSGKSAIPENWLLASVDADPANMLWYMPTSELMEGFVKQRIDKLISEHETLTKKLGLRAVDDSLGFKRFRNMTVEFLAATPRALISKSAGRIVVDEWDAIDPGIGDPKPLLDVRRQTFGRESTILALSHCDAAGGLDDRRWNRGIMSLYRESDRRAWWWQCPECGCWSSPNPTAARVMTLEYPADAPLDEIRDATHLLCPVNGCILEDGRRREMNLTGRWIGAGQSIAEDGTIEGALAPRDTAGFWIVGIMSPFILGGIGSLAAARVKAEREREATGDDKALRTVIVKQWGLPYDPPRTVGSLDATAIADRAVDVPLGQVPAWVRFLTVSVDIQANRFEWLCRGWGERGESQVIETGRRPADPATSPEDWDALLGFLIDRAWPLAEDPARGMLARAIGYDSGGQPGVTSQAYDAWRRFRAKRKVQRFGKIDGRDAWSLVPLKGMGNPNAAPLSVVYPDTARKDRRAAGHGQVPLGQFASNLFKDNLAGQLARADGGPWAVHFPAALRSPEPPHAWFEQLTAETRDAAGRWWNRSAARNEATDLMVMSHVVAHLHGLARMNWERPPAWASAVREGNPLVVTLGGQPAPVAPPPSAPAPAAPPAPPIPLRQVAAPAKPAAPARSSLWKPRSPFGRRF